VEFTHSNQGRSEFCSLFVNLSVLREGYLVYIELFSIWIYWCLKVSGKRKYRITSRELNIGFHGLLTVQMVITTAICWQKISLNEK
jgi:hypothetical protein